MATVVRYFDLVREMKNAYNHHLRLVESAKQRGIKPTARLFATTVPTVRKWWRRYQRQGPSGLIEKPRARHRQAHKTPPTLEAQRVELRKALPTFGARRLIREFDLPISHGPLERIWREHGLLEKRRRKYQRKQDLAHIKAKWPLFQQISADTKDLDDIPHYWPQAQQLGLPAVQYTARCTTTWRKPVKWQEEAAKANKLASVFACNYSDFFLPEADEWRDDAGELIRQTPNLIWHLASKRTNLIAERLPKDRGNGYPNVWLGTSPEMKKYLPRMDALRDIPCVLRWIDCAPILEDLMPDLGDQLEGFDWVCVGREQGSGKIEPRPSDEQWVRNIRDLCAQRGIAFMYTCGGGKRPITDPLLDGKQCLAVPPLRWGFDRLGLPLPMKVVTMAVKSSKKENAA